MPYQSIVFLDGDDATEPLDLLYNHEPDELTELRTAFIRAHDVTADLSEALRALELEPGNEPLSFSVVYHGPTSESIDASFAYLSQWDYGDPTEETTEPSSGSRDDTWEQDGYRLSAHLGMGYIGLERVITLPVESYRCPCCGDDVVDTAPICRDCRDAGCEQSVDASGGLAWHECDRTDTDVLDGAA